MHARIARARVRPGAASAVAEGWRTLLVEYERTGVFHGLVSLHAAEEDEAVTLTFWESSEAADAVARELRERAGAVFAEVLLEPPSVSGYDVLLSTVE